MPEKKPSAADVGLTKVKVGSTRHGNVGTKQQRGVVDSLVHGSVMSMLSLADHLSLGPPIMFLIRQLRYLEPTSTAH